VAKYCFSHESNTIRPPPLSGMPRPGRAHGADLCRFHAPPAIVALAGA
jgi:hypothetical protein